MIEEIPSIGLGTWNLRGDDAVTTIQTALDLGYQHIDTAFNYENQESIGKAIQGWDRESLFITSKAMPSQGDLEEICEKSLKELALDFLDLYLIHWPDRSFPVDSMLEKMERLKKQGKIKRYGVSNFTVSHLKDWISLKAQIYCNQVEFHPFLYQKELWRFCKENNIKTVAYRPLGKGALLKEPVISEIAKDYGKTSSQILLRWLFQKEISMVVKASSKEHLKNNLEIMEFTLKNSDMATLDSLNKDQRFCNQWWSDFDY